MAKGEFGRAPRTFDDAPATRAAVPLWLGIMGPSFSGKTYSALRVATGIQRVTGGDIYMIDTESRRGLHYADKFAYRHLQFGAPFSPLDYLDAVRHCVSKGAKVIIVDSFSHEHDGEGGVLEMHEAEKQRLGGQEKHNFPAWAEPKAQRRRMINTFLQLPVSFVFCFRAKEKTKPDGGRLKELGWMPIAGEEFIYEMTATALLLPGAYGVPTWSISDGGARGMIKLPEQFASIGAVRTALSEDTGERLAQWAAGGTSEQPLTFSKAYPEWGGKRVADAPIEVIRSYAASLQAVLGDASKAKAHAQTRDVLTRVQATLERLEPRTVRQSAEPPPVSLEEQQEIARQLQHEAEEV